MFKKVNILDLIKVNNWRTILIANFTSVGASAGENGYGASFEMKDKDSRYLIMVNNQSQDTPAVITVKAGNGANAGNFEPTVTLGPSGISFIQLESGLFKNVSDDGNMKVESPSESIVNRVFIVSSIGDVKISVLHLGI